MTTLRPRAHQLRVRSLTISPQLVTAFVALAASGLRVWTPDDDRASTICVFRRCTGASCPGCGLTRGMAYLMRGDLATSWQNHPLAILIMIETLLATALYWATTSGRFGFDWLRVGTIWLAAHIPLLLGVWAIRIATGTLPT